MIEVGKKYRSMNGEWTILVVHRLQNAYQDRDLFVGVSVALTTGTYQDELTEYRAFVFDPNGWCDEEPPASIDINAQLSD